MIPDDLFVLGKKIHIAWLSGIWIHPDYRQQGLAKKLHLLALTSWNGMLMCTEYTPLNQMAILGTHLYDNLLDKPGIKIFFKSPFSRIANNRKAGNSTILATRVIDGIVNSINRIKNQLIPFPTYSSKYSYSEENSFTKEAINYIEHFQFYSSFNRRVIELNWIMDYPWISNNLKALEESNKFHFSVYAEDYRLQLINVYHENQLTGVIILSIRDNIAKIPYVFADQNDLETIAKIIILYLNKNNIETLISYHSDLNKWLIKHSKNSCFYRKTIRHYLASKNLLNLIDKSSLIIQDGDGDTLFV